MSLANRIGRLLPDPVKGPLRRLRDRADIARILRSDDARLLRSLCGAAPWCVDSIAIQAGTLVVEGWALNPSGRRDGVDLRINGRAFDRCDLGRGREDVGRVFWYVADAEASGFTFTVDAGRLGPPPWEISRVAPGTERSFSADQSYFWDPDAGTARPLPPAAHRRRVHGGDSADSFLLEGYTTHRKLERAVERVGGRGLAEYGRILDWGCGCGRSTRFLGDLPAAVTGIDIDATNIEWCRHNLPFGDFLTGPLIPPTALQAKSFDLLIGISVFSHLDRADQALWLGELHRLAADGALVAMSVHGSHSIARAGLRHRALREFLDTGFFDMGVNEGLVAVVQEGEHYHDVCTSNEYVREHFGKLFEILDIVPGCIGNHQDLVLMTPKPVASA